MTIAMELLRAGTANITGCDTDAKFDKATEINNRKFVEVDDFGR